MTDYPWYSGSVESSERILEQPVTAAPLAVDQGPATDPSLKVVGWAITSTVAPPFEPGIDGIARVIAPGDLYGETEVFEAPERSEYGRYAGHTDGLSMELRLFTGPCP